MHGETIQKRIAVLYMKTDIHLWQYLAEFPLELEIFQTKVCGKNKKTYTLCLITFFSRKSCGLLGNAEEILYSRSGHRWQYNTAHAHCMLDK